MNSTQCNIEFILEFFYLHHFLVNENSFEFSKNTSTQTMVDNVDLAAWAKHQHQFIYFNKLAIESPYVSSSLNRCIDIIFGYKSCGERAKKS